MFDDVALPKFWVLPEHTGQHFRLALAHAGYIYCEGWRVFFLNDTPHVV
jgi:hypothetical protein